MFQLSRIQLALLACIPFLLTLTILSFRGQWSEVEIEKVFVGDPSCNIWQEDDTSPQFTLYYLPSDAQAKFLNVSLKLHERKPNQEWNSISFRSVRAMVPVNNIRWGNILTLVMDFNDYLSYRERADHNHFAIVAKGADFTKQKAAFFINRFQHKSADNTNFGINMFMDQIDGNANICKRMSEERDDIAQCVASFIVSGATDETEAAKTFQSQQPHDLWMFKEDNMVQIFDSIDLAIQKAKVSGRTKPCIIQPVITDSLHVELKAFTIEVPVLITNLNPLKAFYTPEIFSMHFNNRKLEPTNQLNPQKFKTRVESLRLFEHLEGSGKQTKFESFTIPKIARGIRAFLSYDQTFEGNAIIPDTETMFGEASVSYEMISCEFIISSQLEPLLIECETNPRANHDLRQSEVIYDEMLFIVLAEFANESNFQKNLRYWKPLPSY